MVVTNAKWWNGLPPDIREGLTKAMKEAALVNNKAADDLNNEGKAKIAASKAKIHQLTPEQRKKWQEAMKPVWKKFEKDIGADVIDAAQKVGNSS
jgi:C4-dicarboxylate-binding protein DctP